MFGITIANEKGGVAKTTTAISLGGAFIEHQKKVLLIDLDPLANLSQAFKLEPDDPKQSLFATFQDHTPLSKIILKTSIDGLDLIPAHFDLGTTESLLQNNPNGQIILRNALQPISSSYDLVVFDCPPFLGMLVLNALCASNLLIIPTQPEIFSIHALRNLMKWVNQVRLTYNPGLAYRLLLTMVDLRNRTHRMLSEELNRTFKQGLFETVINMDTKLRESPIAGVPVLTHSPNCRAAVQYRSVAQDILNYVKTKTKTTN